MDNSHVMDAVNILHAMDESDPARRFLALDTSRCDFRWAGDANPPTAEDKNCQSCMDALIALDRLDKLDSVVYSSNKPYSISKKGSLAVLQWFRSQRLDLTIATIEGFINLDTDCYYLINEGGPRACLSAEHINSFLGGADNIQLEPEFKAVSNLIISKVSLLCYNRSDPSTFLATADSDEPLMWDGNHLSKGYALTVGRRLAVEYPEVSAAILKPIKVKLSLNRFLRPPGSSRYL